LWGLPATYFVSSYLPGIYYSCLYNFQQATFTINAKPVPTITMNPGNGMVCPNDSVQITASAKWSHYSWYGPLGQISGDTSVIYAKIEGEYQCYFIDSTGCQLLSNTVNVNVYGTPYVYASPNNYLCQGDTAAISVVASTGATIQWQPPLSGSDSIQYLKTSGTYSCKVVSCGITTIASVTVKFFTPKASISSSGSDTLCNGDSVKLTGNNGMALYIWNPEGIYNPFITVDSSGKYYLTTMDDFGCMANDSVTIITSKVTAAITLSGPTLLCRGDSVTLTANSGMSKYLWTPVNKNNQALTVKNSGSYIITVANNYGCTSKDSITIVGDTVKALISTSGSKDICAGDSVTLTANKGMVKYIWNPGNINNTSINVIGSGIYTLTTTDSYGCITSDTVHITVTPNTVMPPSSNADTSVCLGDSITLFASGTTPLKWFNAPSGGSILGTGTSFTTHPINSSVIYYIESDDGPCKSKRTPVLVSPQNCDNIYVPNVFTPNGDGNNDIWHVTIKDAKCFNVQIFDRWGVMVFQSNDINQGWNGLIMQTNKQTSDGIYYYLLNYCNYLNIPAKKEGFIQLIR